MSQDSCGMLPSITVLSISLSFRYFVHLQLLSGKTVIVHFNFYDTFLTFLLLIFS